jgi:hypothetical protein
MLNFHFIHHSWFWHALCSIELQTNKQTNKGLRLNWNVGMMEYWKNGFEVLEGWNNG